MSKKIYRIVFFLIIIFTANKIYSQTRDINWFWFIFEQERCSRYQAFVIRPFFLNNRLKKYEYEASLPPFIYWKYKTDRKIERHWFLGLASDVDYVHSNNVYDYDLGIFPFLYYGSSPDPADNYFLFWPVGGTIRGKLGVDRISPWIFPGFSLFFLIPPSSIPMALAYLALSFVPVYVSYEMNEYKAHGIFWPLIQWGKSPIRDDFRILPFYAHNYKKGFYDNKSYLLLINYRKEFIGNDTQSTFFFVPFIGRRWNTNRASGSSTLLWPFFSWGYNKRQGDIEINFPWPIVQYQKSEKPFIRKKIFFPIYGYYRYERKEMEFITPLHFSLKHKTKNFTSEYYVNFFIIWYFKREYKNEPSDYYGNSWRYFKIWPLFAYESNDKGAFSFRTLSLLPFRDPDGYEKMYSPFWSLFEYSRTADGTKKLGILLRTYYQCWNDHFMKIKIPILFTYTSYNNKVSEISFLFSMFGYEWNREGKYLRIVWIPIKIGEGRTDIAEIKEEPENRFHYSVINGDRYLDKNHLFYNRYIVMYKYNYD